MKCLAQYKNIFGAPNTGVHSIRLFNIAIVDVILTVIVAIIIAKLTKTNFLIITGLLFIIGIIMHRMFCVRTTIDKLLFKE